MLFNSIDFAVFLPLAFLVHWLLLRNQRARNVFLLLASYVFYGWWDPRFLSLLALSSFIDFWVSTGLGKETRASRRKALLLLSLTANLGMLGFFKYHDFFVSNVEAAFSFFGQPLRLRHLDLILPVGISFYTFQTLSYTIDVYKGRLKPSDDMLSFMAYVSFFPQLVAGPIERATHLLPQFSKPRTFSSMQAVDGLRQMLWGLVKKMVVADNCAPYVDSVFSAPEAVGGSTLLVGAILFSIQIYCDFSGYSDVAIGCARLFGFDLMRNFAYPYFSRDIAEFWRRWHISLSSWFRDYVYVPLGGSRNGIGATLRNTLIIFLLSGFWHGANWTFVCWGAIHALLFLPLLLAKRNRKHMEVVAHNRFLPTPKEALSMLGTYLATVLAWVFFRAEDVSSAVTHIGGIFSSTLFSLPSVRPADVAIMISALIAVEWLGRRHQHPLHLLDRLRWRPLRWAVYYGLIALIISFAGAEQEFIYFQF